MIHSSDCKHQPMDTKKDTETKTNKENAEINNKDYETIRKPVKDYDKTIKTLIYYLMSYISMVKAIANS